MDLSNLDISSLKKALSESTSAMQASQISREMERNQRLINQISEENARRNAVIEAGAKANIEQVGLLERQLDEVKQQNVQLKENYALLKDLYDRAKQDAEDSAKDAKKNRIFGWVSFAVGTLIGIAGVILGIIF